MMTVALTGNVAAGKSSVARVWKENGVPVVSADDLAREAVAPGTPGLDRVVQAFGRDVLAPDGSLDRPAMRRRVFSDPAARRRLEEIVHPQVRALRDVWLDRCRRRGESLAVVEIPLLFETGSQRDFHRTVLVDAPEDVRLDRLVRLRGLPAEEARRIMAAQMDPREKRAMADFVLDNDGTLEDVRRAALALLEVLRAEAPAGQGPGNGHGGSGKGNA